MRDPADTEGRGTDRESVPSGSDQEAVPRSTFESGMARVHGGRSPSRKLRACQRRSTTPTRRRRRKDGEVRSTGWDTFLQAVLDAGLQVNATWPLRTELANRHASRLGANALASSIVLACRPRQPTAAAGEPRRVRRGAPGRAAGGGSAPAVRKHRTRRHRPVDDRAGDQGVLSLRQGG